MGIVSVEPGNQVMRRNVPRYPWLVDEKAWLRSLGFGGVDRRGREKEGGSHHRVDEGRTTGAWRKGSENDIERSNPDEEYKQVFGNYGWKLSQIGMTESEGMGCRLGDMR